MHAAPISSHCERDFMQNYRWNVPLLQQCLPRSLVGDVLKFAPHTSETSDLMIWSLTSSSTFSVSSDFKSLEEQETNHLYYPYHGMQLS